MTVDEFYKEFDLLLGRISDFPPTVTAFKKCIADAVTREKSRRIDENIKATMPCILEVKDVSMLFDHPLPNAHKWRYQILKGYITGQPKTVRPYICEACWIKYDIEGLEAKKQKQKAEAQKFYDQEKERKEVDRNNNIVDYINSKGKEGSATPSQAFWKIQEFYNSEWYSALKNMPYKEFLASKYWFVLRRYVLFKSDYKCKLCAKAGCLHVHHKHYKNRGREIFTWKDDLIVLCANCHSKHHDKLATND